MKAGIKRIANRQNPAPEFLLLNGIALRCRHSKPLPAAVFRHAVEPQYDNPSSDSGCPLSDLLGTVANDLQDNAMEVVQEQFAPQVAIEIDRRCDPVMGRQRKPRMAVRQRFKTIVALRKLQIGAVDLDMRFHLGRDGTGTE